MFKFFDKLYDEVNLPADIRRSINFIFLGNLSATLGGVICGSTTPAMVGLANYLGATDIHFGIITAIAYGANLCNLPFSILVNKTQQRKKIMLTFGLGAKILWIVLGLIPIIIPKDPEWLRIWTMLFVFGVLSCNVTSVNVCWYPWLADLTPPEIFSRFYTKREQLLSIIKLPFSLLVGISLDMIPVDVRYPIVFTIGGFLTIMDMVCFGFAKEVYTEKPANPKIKDVLSEIKANKDFVNITTLWAIWSFASNIADAYLVPYYTGMLGVSNFKIVLYMTIFSAIGGAFTLSHWGTAIKNYGIKNTMIVSLYATSALSLLYLFVGPNSTWMIGAYGFLAAIVWNGANMAQSCAQIEYSPASTRASYIAVYGIIINLICGAGGFVSGLILDYCVGHNLFVGTFNRYRFVILIHVILRFAVCMMFIPKLRNDSNRTPLSLLKAALHIV